MGAKHRRAECTESEETSNALQEIHLMMSSLLSKWSSNLRSGMRSHVPHKPSGDIEVLRRQRKALLISCIEHLSLKLRNRTIFIRMS